jgi:hypothetical protein
MNFRPTPGSAGIYKVKAQTYFDSFSGLIPVKLISRSKDEHSGAEMVELEVTRTVNAPHSKQPAFKKGERISTLAHRYVHTVPASGAFIRVSSVTA